MSSRLFAFLKHNGNGMNRYTGKLVLLGIFWVFASHSAVFAQESSGKAIFRFDLSGATAAPKMGKMAQIDFPAEATRNGVEGVLIAEITLGTSGRVSDIVFIQSLPFGYEQAVRDAFGTLNFEPATNEGKPVPVKLYLEYTVSMVFDEDEKEIKKPVINEQPEPVYPESERADKRKGEVTVGILFKKDGTLEILSVGSTMPKSFDEAAIKAAKDIKFTPGIHKKSEKPVSVKMRVVYKFKP